MFGARMLVLVALAVSSGVFASPASSSAKPAKCTVPSVRTEWRNLSYNAKKSYVSAVKCLMARPHSPTLVRNGGTPSAVPINPNGTRYDDVVYGHIDATDPAHNTGRFLSWHRLYLHTFETILRTECGYNGTLPFWDYALDAPDLEHSPLWDADPIVGLGTFPNASTNYSVATGAFAFTSSVYPGPEPHYIQRNFSLQPYKTNFLPGFKFPLPDLFINETMTRAAEEKMISSFVGNYTGFDGYLEGVGIAQFQGVHQSVHYNIGGEQLAGSYAPNDPMFFFLHAGLDRLWSKWQAYNPANQYAIGGGEIPDTSTENWDQHASGVGQAVNASTILYISGLGPNVPIRDVLNTKGGFLCYEYGS